MTKTHAPLLLLPWLAAASDVPDCDAPWPAGFQYYNKARRGAAASTTHYPEEADDAVLQGRGGQIVLGHNETADMRELGITQQAVEYVPAKGDEPGYYLLAHGLDPADPSVRRVCCISDTHEGHHDVHVPSCDVLVHAGDFVEGVEPTTDQFADFFDWLHSHKTRGRCREVVFHPGNHDTPLDAEMHDKYTKTGVPAADYRALIPADIRYLFDSTEEDVCGLKFWGIGYMPPFGFGENNRMAPDATAACPCRGGYADRGGSQLRRAAAGCPADADVTVSHMGPLFHGDNLGGGFNSGCEVLYAHLAGRVRPKLHVCGHMHEAYGVTQQRGLPTTFVCAAQDGLKHEASLCGTTTKRNRLPIMVYVQVRDDSQNPGTAAAAVEGPPAAPPSIQMPGEPAPPPSAQISGQRADRCTGKCVIA